MYTEMQSKQRHRTTTTLDVRAVGVDKGRVWAKNLGALLCILDWVVY